MDIDCSVCPLLWSLQESDDHQDAILAAGEETEAEEVHPRVMIIIIIDENEVDTVEEMAMDTVVAGEEEEEEDTMIIDVAMDTMDTAMTIEESHRDH